MTPGAAPEIPGYLPVGRVRRPHGIKGDLLVEPLGYRAARALHSGAALLGWSAERGTVPLRVEWARHVRDVWRVHFEEIADRDTAELWRGGYILAAEADLAPREGEGYTPDELLGMEVRLVSGEVAGRVSGFYELRQGLVIEVARDEGEALIPVVPEIVKQIDRVARVVVIEPIPGLLD